MPLRTAIEGHPCLDDASELEEAIERGMRTLSYRVLRGIETAAKVASPITAIGDHTRGPLLARLPLAREPLREAERYVAEHGRIGDGALPVVMLPGVFSSRADYAVLARVMRTLGFDFTVVRTTLRSTGLVDGDARAVIRAGAAAMRRCGTDQYVLVPYSRGGFGAEWLRTRHPEAFEHVAALAFLDVPLDHGRLDPTNRLHRSFLWAVGRLTPGGVGMRCVADAFVDIPASQRVGFRELAEARPDFRAVAFLAADGGPGGTGLIPNEAARVPDLPNTSNEVVRGTPSSHLFAFGFNSEFNVQLAEWLTSLPANAARAAPGPATDPPPRTS